MPGAGTASSARGRTGYSSGSRVIAGSAEASCLVHSLRGHPSRCQVLVAFLLATAACARHQEADRPSFTYGRGHFVWTDSTSHEANRLSYHTRCGSALHVWVRDTLSPIPSPHMIIAVLGFQAVAHDTPTYPDFSHPFPQTEWAQAQLYPADNAQEATVL